MRSLRVYLYDTPEAGGEFFWSSSLRRADEVLERLESRKDAENTIAYSRYDSPSSACVDVLLRHGRRLGEYVPSRPLAERGRE
jgi:hypothetical protein